MAGYYAGFSTAETPMSVLVGGSVVGTATIDEGYFSHVELGDYGISGNPYYNPLSSPVEVALDALSAGFDVAFNPTTNAYTISRAAGTFSLDFTATAAGVNLGRALGFSAGTYSAALSHTSDATPYYIIEPAISARSEYSDLYEPDDLVDETETEGGSAFGIACASDGYYDDWTQQAESKAATLALSATTTVPWTWQHFFRHVRATHPFTVDDGIAAIAGGRVYTLRADGAAFTLETRSPMEADVNTLWVISIMARYRSELP